MDTTDTIWHVLYVNCVGQTTNKNKDLGTGMFLVLHEKLNPMVDTGILKLFMSIYAQCFEKYLPQIEIVPDKA